MIYDKFIRILADKIPQRFQVKLGKIQHKICALREVSNIEYKMYFDSTTAALVDPYYNRILFCLNYYDIRGAPTILVKWLDDLIWLWDYDKTTYKNQNSSDYRRYITLKKLYKYE